MSIEDCISCLDSRYNDKIKPIVDVFSSNELVKNKVIIEIEYLKFLSEILEELKEYDEIIKNFNINKINYRRINEIEAETNHDVKAIEYYVKEELQKYLKSYEFSDNKMTKILNFVHFAITSEDVNSPAIMICVQKSIRELSKQSSELIKEMKLKDESDTMISGLTHGQPATYTTFSNFFMTYIDNIDLVFKLLESNDIYECKFGGETGGLNAHYLAYPGIDWKTELNNFIKNKFGLNREKCTTQISKNVKLSIILSYLKVYCLHMTEFCQNIWMYISIGYFSQKQLKKTTGPSTVPHKVDPINFENAEGNYKYAKGMIDTFVDNILISRLQRDLSGSTIMRRLGELFAIIYLANSFLLIGLETIAIQENVIERDLNTNYQILTEPVQTLLRKWGFENPYETLEDFSKGRLINDKLMYEFIESIELDKEKKLELFSLTPAKYQPVKY